MATQPEEPSNESETSCISVCPGCPKRLKQRLQRCLNSSDPLERKSGVAGLALMEVYGCLDVIEANEDSNWETQPVDDLHNCNNDYGNFVHGMLRYATYASGESAADPTPGSSFNTFSLNPPEATDQPS